MERSTSRKIFFGTVISTKMDKTIVVNVELKKLHSRYHKLIITHKKYHVHDEKNEAHDGDVVEFMETRPLSKTVKYCLTQIKELKK
jgi:small subunit ribosomal protein S17